MPSSLNYERIPDNDINIDDKPQFLSKTTRKLITSFFVLFVLGGVIFSLVMSYKDKPTQDDIISIYQTSKLHNDHLSLLTLSKFQERGFNLEGIEFFNSNQNNNNNKDNNNNLNSINYGDTSKGIIYVDSDTTYQSIIGFGGAFTESSAYNFFKLPVPIRDKFLEAYFGENGIGYTVGRIHINSCDFSLNSYSFDDVPDDFNLINFDTDVTHDTHQIIPFILAAMKKSKQPINLLASPWSPPAWMKVPFKEGNITKSKMTGSNTPNGLKSDSKVMSSWAHYISLFITAYENHGIPIWAITPQNEPEFAAPWEACAYNASFESLFVEKYLGPVIKSEHPNIKILAFDHNKDHLYSWAKTMLFPSSQTNELSQYVDGMAFHWYGGTGDRLLDGTYGYDTVNQTYHLAPNKILMATEGCSCPGVEINSWVRAERLGHDLIFDLNNYAQGWIDWNLLVDHEGGPNHLGNLCDAPIFTREDFLHYHLQPKYYYMGHVSKFIIPGSKRIKLSIVGKFGYQKIHPEIHSGVELGIYYCEQSVKQMWSWIPSHDNTTTGYIKLMMSVIPEGSSDTTTTNIGGIDGVDLQFCISKGDENRNYLRAWECPPVAPDKDDERVKRHLKLRMFPLKSSDNGSFKHFLLIQDDSTNIITNSEQNQIPYCVSSSHGLPHNGALLELRPCSTHDITQHWSLDVNTGELKNPESNLCVTAGWPYLTGTGFKTPDDKTVIVVMNEAPTDTYLTINDSKRGTLISAINGHSIETIIYDSSKK